MAITLTVINPNDPISLGPQVLNDNFATIKTHIDDLENLLNPANNTIKLTNLVTIAANSAEMEAITLTKTSGDALVVNPNGAGVTLSISVDGDITGRKITCSGTGGDASDFQDINVNGLFAINGETTLDNKLKLTGANAQVSEKYTTVAVVDAMTGGSATTPLDVSKEKNIYMDYDNSATPLANNAEVFLDTTNFEEGQIFRFQCFKVNATGMRFWNGTPSAEVFAFVEPNGGVGYQTIADTVKPEFNPSASPNNQSYMICQWQNIGGANFRLVILESQNMLNVN